MAALCRINDVFSRWNQRMTKFEFLSGNGIKIIAIILMFFDHFLKIDFQWYLFNIVEPRTADIHIQQLLDIDWFVRSTLYAVCSAAFPLFCFLISEGFFYTRNRKRYFALMVSFALISEIPFDISFFSIYARAEQTYPFYWPYQNVLFTLLLGLCALWAVDRYQSETKKNLGTLVVCLLCVAFFACLADWLHTDYGAYGVLLIVGFYIVRQNRLYQMLLFLLIYIVMNNALPTIGQWLAMVILLLYNGKRGKWRLKYFFYIFYPTHMLVLYGLQVLMETIKMTG